MFRDAGGGLCAVTALYRRRFEVLGGGDLIKMEPASALAPTHVVVGGEVVDRKSCREGGWCLVRVAEMGVAQCSG